MYFSDNAMVFNRVQTISRLSATKFMGVLIAELMNNNRLKL